MLSQSLIELIYIDRYRYTHIDSHLSAKSKRLSSYFTKNGGGRVMTPLEHSLNIIQHPKGGQVHEFLGDLKNDSKLNEKYYVVYHQSAP